MTVNRPQQPQGCTNHKIRQLMRQVAQHYDNELAKAGVKGTQYALMGHVLKLGPIRPSDLAQVMRMDASTLTRNLKPLVEAGWLCVEQGADARSRSITITEAGQAKWVEARRYWKAAQQWINDTLGTERVVALHALIDDSLELLDVQAGKASNE
jgi:DNA-binding MarR family transcriptional regulator